MLWFAISAARLEIPGLPLGVCLDHGSILEIELAAILLRSLRFYTLLIAIGLDIVSTNLFFVRLDSFF